MLLVVAGAAIAVLAIAYDSQSQVVRELRAEVDSMRGAMIAAQEQIREQRRIMREHADYIESLDGGGDEALGDYLFDGADRLWGDGQRP